jgi:hypothetical protein
VAEDPVKRAAKWALLALLVWWIVQDPTSAAHLVHTLGQGLTHAARSMSAFAGSVGS